jgi:hypothetical protein
MAATPFSPQLSWASPSPSCLWEVPGKPVIVQVALEVVDRLEREVAESFRSLEARGSEIGGLLLGAVQGSSPFEVSIQSYDVVPSEYKRGPLYHLSPRDLERFEDVLEQRVGAGMQIVGFFRSHTRKGLGLDTEDVAIFNRFFPKQYQVAVELLAKPFATKPIAGAIFIREGRSVRILTGLAPAASEPVAAAAHALVDGTLPGGEAPRKRRSFGLIWSAVSATLTGIVRPVKPIGIAPSAKLVAILKAARPICTAASAKLAAATTDMRPMWTAGTGAAALVVLTGLLFFPGLHRTKRPATTSSRNTSPLSFRVERSAGELLLTWNREADMIHEATHAVLAIADGEWYQSVDLDRAQLRHGGIVYLPSNSDINFQLTVTGRKPSQTQSESVRVPRVSPWATPEQPPSSPPKPVPKGTRAANTLALMSSRASEGPGAELAKAPNKAAPQADDLAQRSRLATALDLPDAPGLTSGPQAQAVLIPGNTANPAETQVSLFQLLVIASPDLPEPTVGGRVSEAHHVKSAKVLSGPPVLQNPAVAAVRRWLYRPVFRLPPIHRLSRRGPADEAKPERAHMGRPQHGPMAVTAGESQRQ